MAGESSLDVTAADFVEIFLDLAIRIGVQAEGTSDLVSRSHGHGPFDNFGVVHDAPALDAGIDRFASTPDAESYYERYFEPSGVLQIPVLSLHTTRDPLVPIEHEPRLEQTVSDAGSSALLVQQTVDRFGHCEFRNEEVVHGVLGLVDWVENGIVPPSGDVTVPWPGAARSSATSAELPSSSGLGSRERVVAAPVDPRRHGGEPMHRFDTTPFLRTRNTARWVAVAVFATWVSAAPAWAQRGTRILIAADMEGLTGVVTSAQLDPSGFEYARFRQVMTDEVLAAMEGARAAGATEFLIADSHGNGQNLLIDQLPEDVRVIRSWPRPLGMLQGVDRSIDGVLFIGFHAGTSNPSGVRAHTMSSANLTDLRIGEDSVSEAIWGAAIAGHFGVPVLMLSGDDVAAEESRRLLPDLEVAVVKRALSFHSADTLTPAAGQRLIRETAERAVRKIGEVRPFVVPTPVRVTVAFKNYQPSQVLALLPWFERTDAHSISFEAADMIEASRILTFVEEYRIDLSP